jgi:hypothetical protein
VSAFALGLALGAAAFVGVWQTAASQGDRATAARALAGRRLDDANARSATLSKQLHRAKGDLHSALRQKQRLKVELRRAVHQAALSSQEAAIDRRTLLTLRHRASTVTSDVAALEAYVTATPNQNLDSGFLQTQLVYLSAAAHRLQTP